MICNASISSPASTEFICSAWAPPAFSLPALDKVELLRFQQNCLLLLCRADALDYVEAVKWMGGPMESSAWMVDIPAPPGRPLCGRHPLFRKADGCRTSSAEQMHSTKSSAWTKSWHSTKSKQRGRLFCQNLFVKKRRTTKSNAKAVYNQHLPFLICLDVQMGNIEHASR